MYDVPLEHTEGLEAGMTVAIRGDLHGGFFETFARITRVEPGWVSIDRGLAADYHADMAPVLLTAFPVVFARGAENVAVRNLAIDGATGRRTSGIYASPAVERLWLEDNQITRCAPEVIAGPERLASARPQVECGMDAAREEHYRHLFP